jgi:hypothetical protein
MTTDDLLLELIGEVRAMRTETREALATLRGEVQEFGRTVGRDVGTVASKLESLEHALNVRTGQPAQNGRPRPARVR